MSFMSLIISLAFGLQVSIHFASGFSAQVWFWCQLSPSLTQPIRNQEELRDKSLPGCTNVLGHQKELPSIFPCVYSTGELQVKNNSLINTGKKQEACRCG